MGKPIAGRDKFPFCADGIVVAGAKLQDGTVLNDIRISKQRSVLVFDLLDGSTVHQKLSITSKDATGAELDLSGDDADLADSLAPGTFFVRAINSDEVLRGFVIRFQLKKVVVSDGIYVFDMDYTKKPNTVVNVVSITLNKSSSDLNIGSQEQLVATILPATATNKNVVWKSSDDSIATVNDTGMISPVSNGTVTITATTVDGNKVDSCIYQIRTPVLSVNLNKLTSALFTGNTEQLTATVNPSTASNKSITWESSDTSVITVSNEGLVTAIGNGAASVSVITVDGNKTSSCSYTINTHVSSISLDKNTSVLEVGTTEQLNTTILPSTASNKNVVWSSSDQTIATVSNTGLVTAIKEGTVNIQVSTVDSNKTTSCSYTIKPPYVAVNSVSLNKSSATVYIGKTTQLSASILPNDATNKIVTWTSSDTSVCTVNSTGLITGVGVGSSVITATTQDGKQAICNISSVTYIPIQSITVDKTSVTLSVGQSTTVTATILPNNATDKTITVSNTYSKYVSTSLNGNVLTVTAVSNTSSSDIAVLVLSAGSYETGDRKAVGVAVKVN